MLGGIAMTRQVSLELPGGLPYEKWQQIGEHIFRINDSSSWWLGDWLAYGERIYGTRYRQALQETALDYQTLRNYVYVVRRFEVSRRRDKLSFQHHAELAALPPAEQDKWLDLCEYHGWSRNRLRRERRSDRQNGPGGNGGTEGVSAGDQATTVLLHVPQPQRQRWSLAADHANRSFEKWVMAALDRAADAALIADGERPQSR
ncbi:LmbU family transcriptional regulator [Nonomuraea sp. NPDC005650]|uniref:LmbU family transcriptional regulator n=1 Tax=Nonomuraea sp. NPDC005650 TaxID=3157045 RepID=UPI0033BE02CF